jgi:hypothetical protein
MWSGRLSSNFSLAGEMVEVITAVSDQDDTVAVQIRSELLSSQAASAAATAGGGGGLYLGLAFPYGEEAFSGDGADWTRPGDHTSTLTTASPGPTGGGAVQAVIRRQLDNDSYSATVRLEGAGGSVIKGKQPHLFEIRPAAAATTINLTVSFSPVAGGETAAVPSSTTSFDSVLRQSANAWARFWESGAAIEFEGSSDPRAAMLEKQIVMSAYLLHGISVSCLEIETARLFTPMCYPEQVRWEVAGGRLAAPAGDRTDEQFVVWQVSRGDENVAPVLLRCVR